MSTIVLDTVQDRVSSKQVNALGLAHVWEFVDSLDMSADTVVEFFHDGIDNAGADLEANYSYKLGFDEIIGTAAAEIRLQLFESGAYRSASNNYYIQASSQTVATASRTSVLATYLYVSTIGATIAQGVQGEAVLHNLGDTSRASRINAFTQAIPSGSGWMSRVVGVVATGSLNLASTKFKIFPSSGTLTGRVRLYRRLEQ